jgi:hypothetical protein
MPVIRKPLAHHARSDVQIITPRAVELFKRMKRCRCTCDPANRFDECSGCEQWEKFDEEIGLELKVPVWEYPVLERPNDTNLSSDPGPRERWLALERATRELRRQERQAPPNGGAPEQPQQG